MPDFEAFRDSFPGYAKDIKINLGMVLTTEGSPELSEAQIFGVALASAYSIGNPELISVIESKTADKITPEIKEAAKAAASIMAMNNIYYRFTHLVEDEEYSKIPARLRMNIISNPGIPKMDFELMCMAVSALNGCGMCMASHAKGLTNEGLKKQSIQSSVKIAAVLNSAAKVSELK